MTSDIERQVTPDQVDARPRRSLPRSLLLFGVAALATGDLQLPSGHAMSAIAVFGSLATVLVGLYPRWRVLIVIAASIVITGVGTSRVYLGVHWPLDVLAGFAASTPFVVVTVHLVHGMLKRRTSLEPAPPVPTPRS